MLLPVEKTTRHEVPIPDAVWRQATSDERKLTKEIAEKRKQATQKTVEYKDSVTLLPYQHLPSGDWFVSLFQGGRGSAKTFYGSYWTNRLVREGGKGFIAHVASKTIGNTLAVCINGPSGILTKYGGEYVSKNLSSAPGMLVHRNGGVILVFGAEAWDRFDGPECNLLWADELAVWPEKTWNTALFGVRRQPPEPRILVTTTPKNRKFVKLLAADKSTVVTRADMNDNPHTSQRFKDEMNRRYGGTRLGRQEIKGEFVDDYDGALWKSAWIDDHRAPIRDVKNEAGLIIPAYAVPENVQLVFVVVAVDPAGAHKPGNCETGFSVMGRGSDGEDYLLASEGCRTTPDWWANHAIELYDKYEADLIVGETNYGGDMVVSTLKTAAAGRQDVKIDTVTATRGKVVRAEPMAMRYEQGHVHHVGEFEVLESQMAVFGAPLESLNDVDSEDPARLKDRVDALVWAMFCLMTKTRGIIAYQGVPGEHRMFAGQDKVPTTIDQNADARRETLYRKQKGRGYVNKCR